MSSCNVEALTMERFSHASSFSFQWLLLWSLAAVNLSFELLFIWLHLCSPRQFPFPIILGYRRLSVKFLFIIVFYSNYFSILLLIIDSYIWSFPEHLSFSLLIISFIIIFLIFIFLLLLFVEILYESANEFLSLRPFLGHDLENLSSTCLSFPCWLYISFSLSNPQETSLD